MKMQAGTEKGVEPNEASLHKWAVEYTSKCTGFIAVHGHRLQIAYTEIADLPSVQASA
jgi:hypothetical protein